MELKVGMNEGINMKIEVGVKGPVTLRLCSLVRLGPYKHISPSLFQRGAVLGGW